MTRIKILAAVFIAALAVPSVLAQEARFFIERIEVRNADRVSPGVVVAESRLREGVDYTESEIRDAAARLARLPYLLTAEFALEKGSERGRYVLVIAVTETRSFFYRLEAVPIVEQNPHTGLDISSDIGGVNDTTAALGYRWFLGRRGALHVAAIGRDATELTRGYSAFAVGWTQYDLFGTRAFATLNIKDSPNLGTSPQLVVGMPLSLNQTVTAEYDEVIADYDFDSSFESEFNDRDAQRLARVMWSYNTTNHPFLPTEGVLLSGGPIAIWRDETSIFVASDIGSYGIPVHSRIVGAEAGAFRYWEISERNSVSLGVEGRLGHFDRRYAFEGVRRDDSFNSLSGVMHAGISRSLWTPERRAQGGDSRLELNLRARVRENDYNKPERVFRVQEEVVQASVSWVRHSSWGTIRLGAGVSW